MKNNIVFPHWAVLSFVDLNEQGAPRTHILEFSRALKQYARVTILNPTPPHEVEKDGWKYIHINAPCIGRKERFWNLPALAFAAVICLWRVHRRKPIDVLYIRDDIRATTAVLWARFLSVRCVVEVNGELREERLLHKPLYKGIRAWLWNLKLSGMLALHHLSYRLADRIVTVTDKLREHLISVYGVSPAKIGVFPNGANTDLFRPLDKEECKRRLNLDPDKRYIGFVGNMFKWHGVDDLIKAFSLIANVHQDTILLLVGDGIEMPYLRLLAEELRVIEKVKFIGRVPYEEVVQYINTCEFCISPINNRWRSNPGSAIKIYEYLSCGNPVLSSDIERMEFITENKVGKLYPASDVNALAAGLMEMLSMSRDNLEVMGARARKLAVERLSWNATVAGIYRFIEKVLPTMRARNQINGKSSVSLAIVYTQMGFGGVERVFCDLANGLAANGFNVDLVLFKAVGPLLGTLDKRINIVNLNVLRHPYSLFAFPRLLNYLYRRRPDVILSAVSGPNVAVILAKILLQLKSRVIISYHASISNESLPRILLALQNLLFKKAHQIIAVSDGVAQELASFTQIPRESIKVIYNPIDLKRIASACLEEVTDVGWFINKEAPVIIGVGRLISKKKGFEVLVKAFSLLRSKRSAKLLIIGDGEARTELQKFITEIGLTEDVLLLGMRENPYKYMSRASVFVLPSYYEGLPTVLIEALACGCPVVATDCPHGPREILENGKWGELVPVGDVEAMAVAIEKTLNAPLPASMLKSRALDFSIERIVSQYSKLISGN